MLLWQNHIFSAKYILPLIQFEAPMNMAIILL